MPDFSCELAHRNIYIALHHKLTYMETISQAL
jgi:hypothetical protein